MRVGTVQEQKADIRHQAGGTLGKDSPCIGMAKQAAEHHMQFLARRQGFLRLLHGDEHRQRVELFMRGQAGDGGEHDILRATLQAGAQGRTRGGVAGEIGGVDAERYHRQHRAQRGFDAKPGADMVVDQVHLRRNRGADAGRGADQRVPVHHRAHDKVEDALHDAHGRGGVGDAGNRPGGRAAFGAAPRFGCKVGGGVMQLPHRSDRTGPDQADRTERDAGAQRLGEAGDFTCLGRRFGKDDEFIDIGMTQKAFQKRLARDPPAVDALVVGTIAI